MKIPITKPFIDALDLSAVQTPVKTGWLVQGPEVIEFESAVAELCNTLYGVAVSSCTAALHLSLIASGIKPGDKVIVPSFTYVATANAVEHAGAIPVFTDVDPLTFNMTVEHLENTLQSFLLENSTLPKAVIPVHLFGCGVDIPGILKTSKKYGLKIVEDAACATGTRVGDRSPGQFGFPACFSFHPRKIITTGEGGMIVTDDEMMAEQLRIFRDHGAQLSDFKRHSNSFGGLPEFNCLGYNYRMTDIQGALGNSQMKKLDQVITMRRSLADRYDHLLHEISWLDAPYCPENVFHPYQSYVCSLAVDKPAKEVGPIRDALMNHLGENGIASRPGTHAVHSLGYYRNKYKLVQEQFPNAWMAHNGTIALPLFPGMRLEEQEYIIQNIKTFKF